MKRTNLLKNLIILLAMFLFSFSGAYSADMMQAGEELFYEVSFLGVKLGSIKMKTEKAEVLDGINTYRTKAIINTYKGIPFVDIHVVYQSWIDRSATYSYRFNGTFKSGDYWDFHKMFFNYNKGLLVVSKENRQNKYYSNTFHIKDKYSDGLSIFFVARKCLYFGRTISVPTIVDKDTVRTILNFHNKKETVSIDAIKYPVRTIYFNGKANWTGVYGLAGDFEGWFSDDDARIPIKAKMNVYVGNILIELKKWKRAGWVPPKAS